MGADFCKNVSSRSGSGAAAIFTFPISPTLFYIYRVYGNLTVAFKYIRYYFTASNGKGHGIHSPFVFEFITKVLNDKTIYPAYGEIEKLRIELLSDQTFLAIDDRGAGSGFSRSNRRSVASITKHSLKSRKYGQLLFRIAGFYKPKSILELGTSLGITTAYFSRADPGAAVITMEGAPEVAGIAKENFRKLGISNITLIGGSFDDQLLSVVNGLPSVGLAFIDGNHRMEPTLRYFDTILTGTSNESILVLDDIHWSAEMEQAWAHCKDHPSVTLSIDLFFIGILFFRREIREKQHFRIRF
jgi:predicted O-methyltransferase YrrM